MEIEIMFEDEGEGKLDPLEEKLFRIEMKLLIESHIKIGNFPQAGNHLESNIYDNPTITNVCLMHNKISYMLHWDTKNPYYD